MFYFALTLINKGDLITIHLNGGSFLCLMFEMHIKFLVVTFSFVTKWLRPLKHILLQSFLAHSLSNCVLHRWFEKIRWWLSLEKLGQGRLLN